MQLELRLLGCSLSSSVQWCSSRDSSLGLETSRDSVLMSWPLDPKSWSWDTRSCSHLGSFKPWFLVSEVRNHAQNYNFFEKASFSPKTSFSGFLGYTCGATIFFNYFFNYLYQLETSCKSLRMNVLISYCLGLELKSWVWSWSLESWSWSRSWSLESWSWSWSWSLESWSWLSKSWLHHWFCGV